MASPTQRTLEIFRKAGWHIDVCEYFNYFSKQRHDLFGWIDLLAYKNSAPGVIGIQTTTTGNLGARESKIIEMDGKIFDWIDASNRVILVGWKKYKKPVDRKYWRPDIREIKASYRAGERMLAVDVARDIP